MKAPLQPLPAQLEAARAQLEALRLNLQAADVEIARLESEREGLTEADSAVLLSQEWPARVVELERLIGATTARKRGIAVVIARQQKTIEGSRRRGASQSEAAWTVRPKWSERISETAFPFLLPEVVGSMLISLGARLRVGSGRHQSGRSR